MGYSIPNEFIDELLNRVDIVEVIAPRVTLKKAGRDYAGLCPFHNENTPSFTVSQNKQFFHCFGCGKHGSAIGFLMEYEGLEFVDAVEQLAEQCGLTVPKSGSSAPRRDHSNHFEALNKANRFFQQSLQKSEFTLSYLHNRGISAQTIREFQLGHAPGDWDGLMRRFSQEEMATLLQCGLIVERDDGRSYDKFRDRLMFPIHDKRGRVIAFGGRAIHAEQKPKYLNSPETRLFHKGEELYNLVQARKHSSDGRILIVEGYMDVIGLHQHGIKNAVATLGTATTATHIGMLFRGWQHLIFCFDGDRAGRQAAIKAMHTLLPLQRDDKTVDFVFLPEGQDPDSLVADGGAEALHALMHNATPLSELMLNELRRDINMHSLDGRARFMQRARELLAPLPNGAFKTLMIEAVAQQAGSDFHLADAPENAPQQVPDVADDGRLNPVRTLVGLLLQNPAHIEHIPENLDLHALGYKGAEFVDKIIEICRKNPQIGTASLIEHFRAHRFFPKLGHLANQFDHLSAQQQSLEMKDMIGFIGRQHRKTQIDQLREKQLSKGLSEQEKQTLLKLLAQGIE